MGIENSKILLLLTKLHRIKSVNCGSSSIWKREDVLGWLFDTLHCFLEQLGGDTVLLQEVRLSDSGWMHCMSGFTVNALIVKGNWCDRYVVKMQSVCHGY